MQHLTRYINHIYEQDQHDNSGAIHPSFLGDCDRFAVCSYLGLEKDVPHSQFLKRVFYHGNRIEGWMNDALKHAGILIANSIPVKATLNGINIEGEIDHIIKYQDGWCIADTKSISDYAFKYKSFPYSHHILQVGAYQWMLHASGPMFNYLNGRGPEYPPVLFYVGRGNLVEKTVSAGDNAMHLALEKLETLVGYVKAETIPERPFVTPNGHPYKCANCIRKGGYKRKGKAGRAAYKAGNEPVYVPSCSYFKTCWGVLPVEWSFWSEVKSNADRQL